VVAAALAVLAARLGPTTLVDLGGDGAAALGATNATGPGVADWLSTSSAPAERLWQLAQPCGADLQLIHRGTLPTGELTELASERLAAALAASARHVVVDAGTSLPSDALTRCAGQSLLIIRPCYLALRRAVALDTSTSSIVVIAEPGRCLTRLDIERALGAAVVAELPWDPGVARAVDAGLLQARLPSSLSRPLGRLLPSTDAPARHA